MGKIRTLVMAGVIAGIGLLGAGSALMSSPTEARGFEEYSRCYVQGQWECYPRTPGGMVYLPNPGSPEEAAYELCMLEVETRCSVYLGAP